MSEREQKKIFSYAAAAAVLPSVRRLTEEAYGRVMELSAPAEDLAEPGAREEIDRVVTSWAEQVTALGVEVKGLWLVDFDNGSGYYCWRYPEEGLHYYHSYQDGYSGRMPIQ